METKDLISVIIPVYNVEKYLNECVDSVLAQTYQNFEIILVDDGSADSSGKICDEYALADGRIRVVHKKNEGLSVARNTGFFNAHGEYVYFLDSDDWILPDTLDELIIKAKEENADIVFFDAVSFTDGETQIDKKQRYLRKYKYESAEGYQVLAELQRNKEYHSAVPLLFLKSAFLWESGISFVPSIIYEDMIFTYMVFCAATKAAQCQRGFYQRRYRSESIMTSHKSKKNYLSAHMVYDKVRDYSNEHSKLNDVTAQQYISRCAFNALNLYRQMSSEEQSEYKKDYDSLKKDILEDDAYGNPSLKLRCYGTFFWFCYKMYEKTVGVVLKGKR